MILGDGDHSAGNRATLDDLFRRAGVRHPDALALADPPNRAATVGGAPRALTFAQADRAITAMAATLRGLGLQTDTPIALQFANTVESVIALLGVLRAGMIAVPMPVLWRQQDIVDALGRIGAKAIVTQTRIGAAAHAEIAMQAAVELFPIRYVCAFGPDVPDGVVPLDDIFTRAPSDFTTPGGRPGNPAAHVAAVTFEPGAGGHIAVARSHMELIAGGLGVFLESGLAADAPILSTVPSSSFAGLSAALVPWLLAGGALHLHHGFEPESFAAQSAAIAGGARVLPAAALPALAQAGLLDGAETVLALWRAPERLAAATPWTQAPALIDLAAFGEFGLLAARRDADGMPAPVPLGRCANPRGAAGAVRGAETKRSKTGTLALRGPTVPAQAFPPGAERGHAPHVKTDEEGFLDTGFTCRLERDSGTLVITGAPGALTVLGGYRFRSDEIDALVAEADPAATVIALPDPLLGERLAGGAPAPAALEAELQARGANPLIAAAFRTRTRPDVA
jgi:acyl-CoA synthetase (AMP-forming)/AMP-acid ligase II